MSIHVHLTSERSIWYYFWKLFVAVTTSYHESVVHYYQPLVTDVNECSDSTHNCHTQATCTNIDGSFTCACDTGYTGDGTSCASKFSYLVASLDENTILSM